MGQQTSPILLRKNNDYKIWQDSNENFVFFFLIRKFINDFFYKKGLYVNKLSIKKHNDLLHLSLTFIVSRTSKFYTTKYRRIAIRKKKLFKRVKKKFLKQKIFRSTLKNLIIKKTKFKHFFFLIATICKIHSITFSFKRIDKSISRNLANFILKKGTKLKLYTHLRAPSFQDIIISFILLLTKRPITSFLIINLISRHFKWIKKRQQRKFFILLRDLFRIFFEADKVGNTILYGLKLGLNGKINGKNKASELNFSVGSLHSQTLSIYIDYQKATTYTKLGTYGWKLYIIKK